MAGNEHPAGQREDDDLRWLVRGDADATDPAGDADVADRAGTGGARGRRVPPVRRRRRGRRILGVCVLAVALVLGGFVAVIYGLTQHIAGDVHRIPHVFASINPQTRPTVPPAAKNAETFLLVGSDSRAGATTGSNATASITPGAQRSDVMMLVRLAADRKSAAVVSIPRDSYVDVPGYGMTKINAAYSYGGPGLAIQTVEGLTHIRIDHFAVIDFSGFKAMTDAIGGVNVAVAAPTTSGGTTFHAGINHLDGAQALTYVRQRHGLPRGDLDRVQRQQNVLRAIMRKVVSRGELSHPVSLYHLLSAVAASVSVDDTMSNGDLRSLALSLRNLRGNNVTFLTAPVAGFADRGGQSVDLLDPTRSAQLWKDLGNGSFSTYLAQGGADVLPAAPR